MNKLERFNTIENKVKRLSVKPGMYIRDDEIIGFGGVTMYSLKVWEELKRKIDPQSVVKAEVLSIRKHAGSCLRLTTDKDVKILLYGCNSGYGGEGPRGTAQILLDCGFPKRKVQKTVFTKDTFVMRRRAKH